MGLTQVFNLFAKLKSSFTSVKDAKSLEHPWKRKQAKC
jgi:hypothetical protein